MFWVFHFALHMKEVRAHLRSLRMSPRKVRLVVDTVRGLSVTAAEHQLQFSGKLAARPVLKLLRSAIANAQHNEKLEKASLRIQSIVANGGPTLKRWRPAAMGAAHPILKRTTHITIILAAPDAAEKKEAKKQQKATPHTTMQRVDAAQKPATPPANRGKA